ncbi:MAG: hypothetical protein V7K69_00085 [Nostoc sp.]|uniref:hypothetical protein n=1 Tax=Nostoc sp. TaxID=1180 RepID=UPI002FFB407E
MSRCIDEYKGRNLAFTSKLSKNPRDCNIRNGHTRLHVIEGENSRRESIWVEGRTFTHSSNKQFHFVKGDCCSPIWCIDKVLAGQISESLDGAEISICSIHSLTETIHTEITFNFDDIFSSPNTHDTIKMVITVKLRNED